MLVVLMIKSVTPEEKLKKFWLADVSVTNALQRVGRIKTWKHKHKVERGSCGWWEVSVDWQRQIRGWTEEGNGRLIAGENGGGEGSEKIEESCTAIYDP